MVLPSGKVVAQQTGDRNLPFGGFGQRYADRVTDSVGQQGSDSDGRFDPSLAVVSGFGHPEVERIGHTLFLHGGDQQAVGVYHHPYVARLDRDDHLIEIGLSTPP